MKLEGKTTREIMSALNIKNRTQVETWWPWHRNRENHRFLQPVGKQYSFGKDVEGEIFINLVESLRGKISIKELCAQFEISRSTYYRWQKNESSGLTDLEELVKELCFTHKFRYGYRKITALVRRVRKVSKNTVQLIMRRYGWNCRVKMKKRTKVGQPYKIVNNHLKRGFSSSAPLKKLVTDITYLPFGRKQLYLSSIMDLYNGEIVAYSIGEKRDVAFVLDTLD